MFYGIKYLIVTLVFSHLGFWSGNLFLIASFPDLCLLVPLNIIENSPSIGADEALGPFFFRIINILSICQYPISFSLQMTFLQINPFKYIGNPC